jgi:hypothetical protein
MTAERPPLLSPRTQVVLWVMTAAGALAFGVTAVLAPERAWASFLTSSFYFLTLALGALVFLALGYVGGAGWSSVLKRVAEAIVAWLPIGAIGMLALVLGVPYLYQWSHGDTVAHDPVLAAKQGYLNLPFFAVRLVVVLTLWVGFAFLLRRGSRRQDFDHQVGHTRRNVALSSVFLLLFGVSFSAASVDWLMSREAHWSSTIFGLYNLAGVLTAGIAVITVVAIRLRRAGLLEAVNENHLHDLGKYLLGFTTFWAYLWFSQYLLIWYANLPEETPYYLTRTSGGWSFLFYVNLIAGWALPFLVLLPRGAKRSEGHLYRVALWILGARWLDVYLLAVPGGAAAHPGISLLDVAVLLGFGAAFILVIARALASAPLLPSGDPYLVEGLHHHT